MTRKTLVTSMKNEGPFILEWIAYHRAIGFDRFVVGSNNCEDGTDILLDALALEGFISHRPNNIHTETDPQHIFLRNLSDHWMLTETDWVMVLDADEFLNIDSGIGHLDDILATKADADAIVILWKTFGDAELKQWEGGLVIEQLTSCEGNIDEWNRFHKTIFRPNGKFLSMDAHYPRLTSNTAENVVIYNSKFEQYSDSYVIRDFPSIKGVQADHSRWTWDNARVNHYPFKAPDVFNMKRYRGDNVPGLADKKYVPGSSYHRLKNKNTDTDTSILKMLEQTKRELQIMRSSKIIRKAEESMLTMFVTLRKKVLETYGQSES